MSIQALLVANRGEIAIRVMRAAAELDIRTVAVYPDDDARSLHVRKADEARRLSGAGVAAYLDGAQLLDLAEAAGCDGLHPGYGFLSENATFARLCIERGVTFVGPTPETLELFGDKATARALAERRGVQVLAGTGGPTSVEEVQAFLGSLGPGGAVMIKALTGGGGRGMRAVTDPADVEAAFERCRSEAEQAFGNGDVYVEQLLTRARHIEVQVVGDGTGAVSHCGERECTIQRRNQKLVEVAPSPGLSPTLRTTLVSAAVQMAQEVSYRSLGTFEFLVEADREDESWAFIEANPRLQVEHTVTEEVTGVDLVQTQLRLAGGSTLAELGLEQSGVPAPRGFAMQVRVNSETMAADGTAQPAGGTLTAFEVPSGPGVRTDTFGYAGYTTSPRFDSLLAKVIVHSRSTHYLDVVRMAYRALSELRIEGVPTNRVFLQNLLRHPAFTADDIYTRFVEDHAAELVAQPGEQHAELYFGQPAPRDVRAGAGATIDANDPLAVLAHGKSGAGALAGSTSAPAGTASRRAPNGTTAVGARMQGTVVSLQVAAGDLVHLGQQLLVMEAMKMEHVISAETSGLVRTVDVAVGDTVFEGHPLLYLEERPVESGPDDQADAVDLDHIRPDLAEVLERQAKTQDEARPAAVARRRAIGRRTTRENVADLVDPGTFVEYGSLVVAAQRRRRSMQDLIDRTPADGFVAGIGSVNGALFGETGTQCVVTSYDYTVLAGTQGLQNHRKKDRMFEIAETNRLPLVLFAAGGGGRPGDTDGVGATGLDCMAFNLFARLSGQVPLVGILAGPCFAGNAALLGCCDVIIATEGSNLGMGGPAMIEGGGLGVFRPEEVGPIEVQEPNGVVDVLVEDEAEAVRVAKQYLSYFQGVIGGWECADQRRLRRLIPENRLRIYDVRQVIETLADTGSVLELRRNFGRGMVTSLIRIEGRPVGLLANNPHHLGGAIDSDGADKAARFMQLCDAFDLPILSLCDTPGMMVGPEVEKTALVRHCSRLFVTGANITVPMFTIVLRKGYGLGAQAMAAGSFKVPFFTVAWPTGEFGGMGIEGFVKLGYRNELAAVEDPSERVALYEKMVANMYDKGKAISEASYFEIDDVIDPVDSRHRITMALRSVPARTVSASGRRAYIDPW